MLADTQNHLKIRMKHIDQSLVFKLSFVCGATLLGAGCAPIQYHTLPEGRPSAELIVTLPAGTSAYSYVIVSAYEQPESCIDGRLMPNSTANPGEPAINNLEAGRLQTIRMTLMRRGINGHQWQCASMLGFLPEAGARYEINPLNQAWQCVPTMLRRSPDGSRLPVEQKLRTPAPSGFSSNKNGDCADRMILK